MCLRLVSNTCKNYFPIIEIIINNVYLVPIFIGQAELEIIDEYNYLGQTVDKVVNQRIHIFES